MPFGLIEYMARVQCGRNAWAVMACLSQQMYADGKLGMRPREAIAGATGLTEAQVSRGMADLKERLVIEPVVRWNSRGKEVRDKSSFGHVARYQLTKEAWSYVNPNMT